MVKQLYENLGLDFLLELWVATRKFSEGVQIIWNFWMQGVFASAENTPDWCIGMCQILEQNLQSFSVSGLKLLRNMLCEGVQSIWNC